MSTESESDNSSPPLREQPKIRESETIVSPACEILNTLEKTHGYGRLRHISRMKREKFLYDAHPPLSVRWDELNLSSFIEMLESCGRNEQRINPTAHTPAVGRFDPRAPHFDVIVIDLTNSMTDKELRIALFGPEVSETKPIPEAEELDSVPIPGSGPVSEEKTPEAEKLDSVPVLVPGPALEKKTPVRSFKPPPSTARKDMDTLPMESLAGRPGWLFLWAGETSNLMEAKRIMARWGFRKIECIAWMRTDRSWEIFEDTDSDCDGIFCSAVEWCIVGLKGSAKRFVFFSVFLVECRLMGSM